MRVYSSYVLALFLGLGAGIASKPAVAAPRAYIGSCCGGGTSVSFLNNATNRETGFLANVFAGAIAFSPDSKTAYLASGGSIQIVDVASRKVTGSFVDPDFAAVAIATIPNGSVLYVAENGTVSAFSLPQGTKIATMTIPPASQCTDIKVSADGSRVYVACQMPPLEGPGNNYFTAIDATQNKVLTTIQTRGGGSNSFLALSPTGAEAYMTVAGAHFVGYAVVDLSTDTPKAYPSLPNNSNGLAIAPDGSALYSSGADEIYAVTPDTGQLLHTIAVSARPAGIAVRPDGKRLLVTDPVQNEVLVVNLATTKIVARVPTGGAPAVVAISPDGTATLTGNSASTIVDVVDTGTDKITGVFEAGASPGALAVTPDGSRVFVADQGPSGYNGGVMVIDTSTFRRLAQIPVPGAATVAILPNGSTVYCGSNRLLGSNNGTISVIDASTYKITTTIALGTISASVPNLAISPDGSKLYAAYTDLSGENTLVVISTVTNMVTQKIPISSGASFAGPYVALSPDGERAYVTLTNASQLAVIDTAHNTVVTIVSITPNYPVSLAVHPNGTVAYLVSSLGFNGIDVFDLKSNTVTGTIAAPGSPVPFNVVFTPDGSKAYMTEELAPVLIIDTATQTVVGQLPVGNSNSMGVTVAAH